MIRCLTASVILTLSSASMLKIADNSDIPMESKIGSRLLSKARRLNDNDDGIDFTWVKNYSLKFDSCHTTTEFRPDGGHSGDEEDGSPTESQLYVQFKLCPSSNCGSCRNGADYLVEMREYLEAYYDFEQEQQEYNCENLKNNCVCDDDNLDEEDCFEQCYTAAGMDYCADEGGEGNDDDSIDVYEYLECREINDNDDDSTMLYVGPMCSRNGKNIYLGEFKDRRCSTSVTGEYEKLTGKSLPYSGTSIVSKDCISCEEPVYNDDDANENQNDQDDEDGIREICQELYERSAKCEKDLKDVDYKYTGACEYIHKMLPQAERIATRSVSTSTVLAWLFGISTLLVSVYAFFLYRRLSKGQVALSSQGFGVTA